MGLPCPRLPPDILTGSGSNNNGLLFNGTIPAVEAPNYTKIMPADYATLPDWLAMRDWAQKATADVGLARGRGFSIDPPPENIFFKNFPIPGIPRVTDSHSVIFQSFSHSIIFQTTKQII